MMEKYGVTNLTGSPTTYFLLIVSGAEAAAQITGRLRVAVSDDGPLNREVSR